MAKRITPAQRRVLDAIIAGQITRADTDTSDGRIVGRLIDAGLVKYERTVFHKGMSLGWTRFGNARRIGSTRTWIGLTPSEVK